MVVGANRILLAERRARGRCRRGRRHPTCDRRERGNTDLADNRHRVRPCAESARLPAGAPHRTDRYARLHRGVRALSGDIPAARRHDPSRQVPVADISAAAGSGDAGTGPDHGAPTRQEPSRRGIGRHVAVADLAGRRELLQHQAVAGGWPRLRGEGVDRVRRHPLPERQSAYGRLVVERPAGALFSYRYPRRYDSDVAGDRERSVGQQRPCQIDLRGLVRPVVSLSVLRLRLRRPGGVAARGTGCGPGRWRHIPDRRDRAGRIDGAFRNVVGRSGVRHPSPWKNPHLRQGAVRRGGSDSPVLPARIPRGGRGSGRLRQPELLVP